MRDGEAPSIATLGSHFAARKYDLVWQPSAEKREKLLRRGGIYKNSTSSLIQTSKYGYNQSWTSFTSTGRDFDLSKWDAEMQRVL